MNMNREYDKHDAKLYAAPSGHCTNLACLRHTTSGDLCATCAYNARTEKLKTDGQAASRDRLIAARLDLHSERER